MEQINGTEIQINFGIRKVKDTDRKPTQEDFENHFKKEDIPTAKEIFTTYDPIEEKFHG
ncbi:hypothetical protein [Mammaliicoccus vitulinus]|uniref:hypothetical protein n=1 Tax=Mammaliicoccus vitulinus TaxID=71237 RepID=UPI00248AE9BF|nr:hypothetical protein [Mammaliicoccus vitulinus]